jgi:hypothetical protein
VQVFYRYGIAMLRMHKRVLRGNSSGGSSDGDSGLDCIQSKEAWWRSLHGFTIGKEFDFNATLALGFVLQLKRAQISQVSLELFLEWI